MKNLFCSLVFIFIGFSTQAFDPKLDFNPINHPTTIAEKDCDLPAPNNLTVTGTSSNSVSISWSPVPGAADYFVEVYELPLGNLLTSFPTTNTTATATAPPATSLKFVVRAGCGSAQYSPNSSEVKASTDFVIEIVNNGYQSTSQGATIHITSTFNDFSVALKPTQAYRCSLTVAATPQGGGTPISYAEVFIVFANPTGLDIKMGTICGPSNYLGYCGVSNTLGNTTYSCPGVNDAFLRVCNSNSALPLRDLKANRVPGSPTFDLFFNRLPVLDNIVDLYITEIPTVYSCGSGLPIYQSSGSGENTVKDHSDNTTNTTNYTLTAAPNPFTDHLTVLLEATGSTDLQLVDMSGKVWRSQSTEQVAGDLAYIETTDMPVGIYLLRVQTSKGIVTKKVVKIAQ
jgi:hypothetical protein